MLTSEQIERAAAAKADEVIENVFEDENLGLCRSLLEEYFERQIAQECVEEMRE